MRAAAIGPFVALVARRRFQIWDLRFKIAHERERPGDFGEPSQDANLLALPPHLGHAIAFVLRLEF